MRFEAPHPIPYQGSKRQLADTILSFVPAGKYERLIEPFGGSGAITLAAAKRRVCRRYIVGELLLPLVGIWQLILHSPEKIIEDYSVLWRSQLANPTRRFNQIREQFNEDQDPAKLLFLLARCVKNSVRFSQSGGFNQSADKRRLGVRPQTLKHEILGAHNLLAGRADVRCADFRQTLAEADASDVVYMDPPYQGVSNGRDSRYIEGVRRETLVSTLEDLNGRGISYLLSYDGICGEKSYGEPLPVSLGLKQVLLDAGRSSQATLSGKKWTTMESLYLSPGLWGDHPLPDVVHRGVHRSQLGLFY
ncbi:MAG: DNA adenine methylase [Terriglobia bacterium]